MLRELFEEQRPLMMAGLVSLALFGVTALLAVVDDAQILGVDRWIKPMKFFISIAIFLWTLAVFFRYLPGKEKSLNRLSWAMIAIFVIEMVVIAGQPLRMQRSHFNIATPLDGALFSIMGVAILVLTLIMAYLTWLFFRSEVRLPPAVAWGIRLGLAVTLLGSIEGGYMSAQLGHAVGVADGGEGLPIVNWSTRGGDLRVAHFMGLHGMQAVPLFGLAAERFGVRHPIAATAGFAAAYTAAFTLVFLQAIAGRPLIAI